MIRGNLTHPRSVVARGFVNNIHGARKIDPNATAVKVPGKHRYLMPLDADMRAQIMPLSKPYPKRVKQAMADDQLAQRQGSTDPHAPNAAVNHPEAMRSSRLEKAVPDAA
jgi:hypothetical protein